MFAGDHALFTMIRDRFRDTPLLVADAGGFTGADLDAMVAARAVRFGALGARPGRWIGARVSPTLETVVELLALWQCGAGVVVLDPRYPPGWEAELVQNTGVMSVVSSGAEAEGIDWLEVAGEMTGPAVAVYTSGTESQPRAVVHDLNTLTFAARAGCARLGLEEGSVIPLTLPPHHVSGLMALVRALVAGATVRLPGPGEGWRDLLRSGVFTHISLVAAQLKQVLEDAGMTASLRRARCVLLGGGPVSDALLDRAWQEGIPVVNSYGMTETAAMVAMTPPGENPAAKGAVPLYAGCLSVDETDRIRFRGPALFRGWLEKGRVRSPELDPGGWYRTGDSGRLDEQGRLHVLGRADTVIISGGEKIRPEWLAVALMDMPGVLAACVVGVPDATYGEVPVAMLAMADGFTLPSLETVGKHIGGRLPAWARPRYVWPWPVEVSPPSLKPPVRVLREWARARMASADPD
ncbi:MAG TPA: AMP-binding protein [Candidatus Hydrogenedentes bacterium]|nr:AMP-binding protein [Candidatus Hydrogenedentota bacterium]